MKERDILGVKTYSDTSYVFSWDQGSQPQDLRLCIDSVVLNSVEKFVPAAFLSYANGGVLSSPWSRTTVVLQEC